MTRYVLAWIPMLLIAIANAAIREATFARVVSELRAHQISTLTASIALGAFIAFVIRRRPPASTRQAVVIGLIWLALTVAFEFFMGLVLAGRPVAQVLEQYNLLAGRVWPLLLAWIAVAPVLFHYLQTRNSPTTPTQ